MTLIFLIFDNQHNGTEDNNNNKKAVTYRSEDASNFFNFMTVMIIISYILYNVSSGLSVLSISLCTALVFCVIMYVRVLYTIVLPTRAMLNVLGKCDVLGEAMQPFVHHQHDDVVKIKYREELRSRYAKFVYWNHNRVVRGCHVSRCRNREPSRIPVKKLKRLSQKSRKRRVFVWKKILKITPLPSRLHGYISCRLSSQMKRRRIIASLRSFEKVRKKPASIRRKFRQTVRLLALENTLEHENA